MAELMDRQQRLWDLLREYSPIQPMLRISREDDCLWICDLPRRLEEAVCETVRTHLEQNGFSVYLQEKTHLWQIDLLPTDALFTDESLHLLPFPDCERLHGAYALYRMLKKHPSPYEQQPVPLIRSILKLTLKPPEETSFFGITSQCAALLNRKQPLPSAACKTLAQWISQEDQP